MTRPRRFTIHLTRIAQEDLDDIHDFIAAESPQRASRVIERLLARIADLVRFPLAHPAAYEARPDRPLRQVIDPPFRVVYEVVGARIIVLAIRHDKRRPSALV